MYEESEDYKVIYVNTKKVGYLVGHHGRTIWHFQEESGAKIEIVSPNSRAKETPVKISGPTENVRRALRMILDLFSLDNYSSRFWQQMKNVSRGQTKPCNEQKIIIGHEETKVPSYFTEFLRVSEGIQKIEEESGSKVIVIPEHEGDTRFSIINVIGTAEGNTKAFEILNERYREVEEANQNVASHILNEDKNRESHRKKLKPCKEYDSDRTSTSQSPSSENCVKPDATRSQEECLTDVNTAPNEKVQQNTKAKLESRDVMKTPTRVLKFINIQLICKKNNVLIEVESKSCQLQEKENQENQALVISGIVENIESAKNDLSLEIDEWMDHLSKKELESKETEHNNAKKEPSDDLHQLEYAKRSATRVANTSNLCNVESSFHNKLDEERWTDVGDHPYSNINQDASFFDYIGNNEYMRNVDVKGQRVASLN